MTDPLPITKKGRSLCCIFICVQVSNMRDQRQIYVFILYLIFLCIFCCKFRRVLHNLILTVIEYSFEITNNHRIGQKS